MIGKQTKGTSFGGCVRYVLKEEKSKFALICILTHSRSPIE